MVTSKLATAEDVFALPDDGFKHYLWRGEIRKVSPTQPDHGMFAARMALPLFLLIASNPGIGEVFIADAGFLFRRDPDTVLAPDAAFVLKHDLPARGARMRDIICIPTLVIEVVSESNTPADVRDKLAEYLAAGVPLIWVAYPKTKTVLVDGAGRRRMILTENDTLDGSAVLPGLPPLRVADIFR